ncbi:MAG: hypothetical protein AABZ60_20470 [Planctomycetota bacterium]
MQAFEEKMSQGGELAIETACLFFMKNNPVFSALQKISKRLHEQNIPYAIVGGMALVAHGYLRNTVDVDILITAEDLQKVHQFCVGLGYVPVFEGSKNLRDTEFGVRIEFLKTGDYPGDGKPKPVAFPHPESCSFEINGIRYIQFSSLMELKLASGMTNPGRIKDLADVQEFIKIQNLPNSFAEQLNPYVQATFLELWKAVDENSETN